MNLQQLRTLVAIRDHSGFADAAASVFLTPAAISQQMRGLEDELQVALFDRTTRPPRLTPHAETLVDTARDVLARFDAFAAKARAEGEIAGTLTLGSATGITSALVPKALAARSWRRSSHARTRRAMPTTRLAPRSSAPA